MHKISPEAVADRFLNAYNHPLLKQGVSERRLAEQLARELQAKRRMRIKVKGHVDSCNLGAKNARVVAYSVAGAKENEETIIEFEDEHWSVRQQARLDAQRLFDLYPVERKQLDVDHQVTVLIQRFCENKLD